MVGWRAGWRIGFPDTQRSELLRIPSGSQKPSELIMSYGSTLNDDRWHTNVKRKSRTSTTDSQITNRYEADRTTGTAMTGRAYRKLQIAHTIARRQDVIAVVVLSSSSRRLRASSFSSLRHLHTLRLRRLRRHMFGISSNQIKVAFGRVWMILPNSLRASGRFRFKNLKYFSLLREGTDSCLASLAEFVKYRHRQITERTT